MFTRFLTRSTSLDRAIALSVTAMLAMNIVVLSQQLGAAPAAALAQAPAASQQA